MASSIEEEEEFEGTKGVFRIASLILPQYFYFLFFNSFEPHKTNYDFYDI